MPPVYERYSGRHVADRVKTIVGTDDDKRLSALVGTEGWRLVEDAPAGRPGKSASKAKWVSYVAEALGMSEDEAAQLSKDELIQLTDPLTLAAAGGLDDVLAGEGPDSDAPAAADEDAE